MIYIRVVETLSISPFRLIIGTRFPGPDYYVWDQFKGPDGGTVVPTAEGQLLTVKLDGHFNGKVPLVRRFIRLSGHLTVGRKSTGL